MVINVNDLVRVRLTDRGREVAARHGFVQKEDVGGWSSWQMWELMRVFGSGMGWASKQVFVDNEIKVVT